MKTTRTHESCYHLVMVASLILSCWTWNPTKAQERLEWGDQGNGTYINPVLNADYSDPDVIRVDGKYYMVASDFHFIGMQVLESEDLVNWHIISQVYDRFDYPGWNENKHYGGGSWAPSIRYHDGRFFVFFCTYEEGLFMSSAEDPHGPWSPLHCVKEIPKWEDPCPFWDDDGQAYLGRSRHRAGPIIIHKMSVDGKQLLDEGVTVYTGPVAEGTKFLKKDGYYYLIIPEGGVGQGWQTVLRSRNIYGPYEKKVVLEQGSTHINGPHQGALVDTPDGNWWFFHFQETHPRGRVVHLQPTRWHDGWPLMGVDIDGNGIGEPVYVWAKDHHHATTPSHSPTLITQLSDDFSNKDSFWVGDHQRQLGLQWQWNHNPHDEAWSLSERKGWLTLHALRAEFLATSHNMLTQKTVGYESVATTRIDCSGMQEGTHAGLLCSGNLFMGIGIAKMNGKLQLYIEDNGKREMQRMISQKMIELRVTIDSERNTHQFAYSTDGKKFTPIGKVFALRMGSWKGSRVGLYCYNTLHDGGKAQFDNFTYHVVR